jgi:hypothetical protein
MSKHFLGSPTFGTDQISFDNTNFEDNPIMDFNGLTDIDKIKDQESRLLSKLNQYKPNNNDRLFIKSNIEDYVSHDTNEISQPRKKRSNINKAIFKELNQKQYEIYELESQNDNLLIMILFLVILIVIQACYNSKYTAVFEKKSSNGQSSNVSSNETSSNEISNKST